MFYFCPGSSSMAPHVALHEIGVPFERRPVPLARNEARRPLAFSPGGKVPLLVVDRHPEAELMPSGDRRPRRR